MSNLTVDSAVAKCSAEIHGMSLSSKKSQKRPDYIDWESYFMGIACLLSKRSKDPATQVGACIVNCRQRIVGLGYNGMPRGCCDNAFPWDKTSQNPLERKYFYGVSWVNPSTFRWVVVVCHAEMNAVFNRNCADVTNCAIYCLLFPCNQCAKTIIQSGISEVVFMGDKNINTPEATASLKMFEASGVKCRQFRPPFKGFKIDFLRGVSEECVPNSNETIVKDFTKKRENCLSWDDYFLAMAILAAKRSKSPSFQMGACIVNQDNHIVGVGYNGMPHGCSDDNFPWGTDSENPLDNKHLYECHAELNAILNAGLLVKGCTMYTIDFPCNECAKGIIQSGISHVTYLRSRTEEPQFEAARRMLDAVKVTYRQHTPKQDHVLVDFTLIDA